MFLQLLAKPGPGLARKHIDRRLVALVQMRLGARAGRDRDDMHAEASRTYGLRRNALEIVEPLLAGLHAFRTNHATARIG
ncbi:hypothetical protein D3C87_2057380 [compost metagenome]